jgi:ABC-type sugar transport system permease subunit
MDQVPQEIIEAGKIDGTSPFREFISIVVPYIAPTVTTFIIAGVATIFTNQNNLYSFFGDDIPSESFRTIGYELYRMISKSGHGMSRYCYASFLGLISTCVAVPLTFAVRKILSKVGER